MTGSGCLPACSGMLVIRCKTCAGTWESGRPVTACSTSRRGHHDAVGGTGDSPCHSARLSMPAGYPAPPALTHPVGTTGRGSLRYGSGWGRPRQPRTEKNVCSEGQDRYVPARAVDVVDEVPGGPAQTSPQTTISTVLRASPITRMPAHSRRAIRGGAGCSRRSAGPPRGRCEPVPGGGLGAGSGEQARRAVISVHRPVPPESAGRVPLHAAAGSCPWMEPDRRGCQRAS